MGQITIAPGIWIDDQDPEQPPEPIGEVSIDPEWDSQGRDTDMEPPTWNSQWWQGL